MIQHSTCPIYSCGQTHPFPGGFHSRVWLTCLFLLLVVVSACDARTASDEFISHLVVKRNYSLSPSGKLLLITEQLRGRPRTTTDEYNSLVLRELVPTGPTAYHTLLSRPFSRAMWSSRTDRDELLVVRKRRLYRVDLPQGPSYTVDGAVAVLFGGLFNFSSYFNHFQDPRTTRLAKVTWYRYMGVRDTKELLNRTADINPCRLAADLRSATLILAPELDRRTHPDQALSFHDELRARGVRSRLRILRNDGKRHRLVSRQHVVDLMARSADFFYQNLVQNTAVNSEVSNSDEETLRDRRELCLAPKRSLRDVLKGK